MRKYLLAVLAVMAVPALALAQISGSAHDIRARVGYAATDNSGGQICVYCHTPHNAQATKILWNHTASTTLAGWATGSTTTNTTPLPTNVNEANSPSGRCMSCHDGSIAVGDVLNFNGAPSATMNPTHITNAAYLLNSAGIQKSHPVHVPYKGSTYFALTSAVPLASTEYKDSLGTGCVGSSYCAGGSTSVPLYGSSNITLGVECGSCHEPHNKLGTTNFLRLANTGSALCLACHNK
jgi:predicted CXXCH cytochrome family protein